MENKLFKYAKQYTYIFLFFLSFYFLDFFYFKKK